MGLPAHQATFTADDFLAWESIQLDRHEHLDGETDKHFNRLKASIAPLIGHHPSAKTFVILTKA